MFHSLHVCACVLSFLGATVFAPVLLAVDQVPQVQQAPSVTEVSPPEAEAPPGRLLVFSKTAGFRHGSIAAGIQCMEALGAELGFQVLATEDSSVFTQEGLAGLICVREVLVLN